MITAVEIGFGFKTLKAALEALKDIKSLAGNSALNAKLIELQGLLIEAQAAAIEAHEAHATQIKRIAALEQEIADAEAKRAALIGYELKRIDAGAVAYMLKPSMRGAEPAHWLCASCYGQGQKGFLQLQGRSPDRQNKIFRCSLCRNQIMVPWTRQVEWLD